MALLSDKQQRNLLIALGLADFATRSRLSTAAFDVIVATARGVGPVAARGALGAAVSVGRTALGVSRLVMVNPYIVGATALYVGYHERERIKQLLDQGYEIVQEQTAPGRQELFETMGPRPAPFIPEVIERFRPKRKPSAFNKAVAAGMLAVKKSPSYGKRGVIKPAKKAFALVTKLAAAKKKKKKAPKSGIRRRIWNAMKGLR